MKNISFPVILKNIGNQGICMQKSTNIQTILTLMEN